MQWAMVGFYIRKIFEGLTMRKPYFHVGEEVILQSVSRPDLNGEYTVRQVLSVNELFICRNTGKKIRVVSNFTYLLEEVIVCGDEGMEMSWYERALRKKHKPSDDNFQQMMNKFREKEHG
ncbi:hypothetical protein O4_68 [Pseudomonas phage O4]|uniref:hypothetical protein n=1 Tax=Pseudomonas phage O4 TaxID=1784982 RepID=UPI00078CF5D4|nr:hypothetical protein BJD45_gp74 [Pseudomonas phage O4]AMO43543.1 hypothetical protein O4_68 [Pseudomonas phage O4]